MKSALLVSILAALTGCEGTHDGEACLAVPAEQTSCPAANSVRVADLAVNPSSCNGEEVVSIRGTGTRKMAGQASVDACCYAAEITDGEDNGCVVGRPYFERGVQRQAPLRSSLERSAITDADRAAAWALAGSGEHASVASFARLSLQLMWLGAPSSLLRDVHQAALDEVKHAEQCWELARQFGGAEITAGPFPFHDSFSARTGLAELAAAAVREGCLAETLGAHVLGIAAQRASEPEVRAALASMAEEETRHAVLSFRIVAWALQIGGVEVQGSVQAAFAEPWPRVDVAELSLRSNVAEEQLVAAMEQGIREVLTPAANRLLAS